MEQRTDEEKLMVRYLLGELSEAEQTQLEDRFFMDNDLFELLQMVKDELIDDYVQGLLSAHERERFERHFLSSPQRRHEVELARTLVKTVAGASAAEAAVPAISRPAPVPWWTSLRAFLSSQHPAFRVAMAVAALVIVFGGAWLIVQTIQMQTRLQQLQANLRESQQREQELEQQLAQQGARRDELTKQLERERNERERLEQELAAQAPSRPSLVSFVLLPTSRFRSEAEKRKRLVIPAGAQLVQFKIEFETEEEYKSYRVVLRRRAEEGELWSQSKLRAQSTAQGKSLGLRLPTNVLTTGDYRLTLLGVTAGDELDEIRNYDFSMVRR